ncbi:hypothetical protein ACUUL3_00725 [Thiovibrio sp. JS02]
MTFESFEEALHICMTAEPDSEEQDAALAYCLENAPEELKEKIKEGLASFHNAQKEAHDEGCGCGCHHDH